MGDVSPNARRLPKHLHRGKKILDGLAATLDGRDKPLNFLRPDLPHLIATEIWDEMLGEGDFEL